jgi:hypothetical protein
MSRKKKRLERMRARQEYEQERMRQAAPVGGFHFDVGTIERGEPAVGPPLMVRWRDGADDQCDYAILLKNRVGILKAMASGENPQIEICGLTLREDGLEKLGEFASRGFGPIYFHGLKSGDHYMTANMTEPQYLEIVKLLVRDFFEKATRELKDSKAGS